MYEYRATAISVHDGDTCTLDIDLGLHTHVHAIVRLAHVNAPELHEALGAEAARRLAELIMGKDLIVNTTKDRTEKYGRWLATIRLTDVGNTDVGDILLGEGLARKYEGGRR